MSRQAFSDLRIATYCPRKLYYRRREPSREPPPTVDAVRTLSRRYEELRTASDEALAAEPIAVEPGTYRDRLEELTDHPDWGQLVAPPATDVFLSGRDAHGVARKLLAGPPRPVVVSPGEPPERGVWEPHGVWATAAALALAWERGEPVDRALVEYPAHARVRSVRITAERRRRYRRVLETVEEMEGPPSRIEDDAKCEPCEYREECGVRTRTLRSLLS